MRSSPPQQNRSFPPPSARLPTLLVTVLTTLLAVVASLVLPPTASALTSSEHGVGYLWRSDNTSWLGTYRMADGRLAFCLEAGKPSPVGHDYSENTTVQVPGLDAADTARLAYIARTWASTPDQDTAAAGQLAVWSITGLNGHTMRYYAGRANERADLVLDKANEMLAQTSAEATLAARSTMDVALAVDGRGSVTAALEQQDVRGAWATVPASQHRASLELVGGHLASGEPPTGISNGESLAVVADGSTAELRIAAGARFEALPYGRSVTIGTSSSGSQAVLFAAEPTGAAAAAGEDREISPLPFAPRVVTQTSSTVASAGTRLADRLHIDAEPSDGALSEWGRYSTDEGSEPIPVVVRSSLLGPFAAPISEAAERPADAPVVCEVATRIDRGAGDYTTKECSLPGDGYFVWVETIDPVDTPEAQGRDRVRGWSSRFGVAAEVTFAPFVPVVGTVAGDHEVDPGACVIDELDVAHLNPAAGSVAVESVLLGPFDSAPADGDDLAQNGSIDHQPSAGTTTTVIDADGAYSTECLPVEKPGHYVFVFRSDGSEPDASGGQIVPAFADLTAHSSEMFEVRRPDTPSKPPATQPVVPAALAFTGASGLDSGVLAGIGALSLGGVLSAGTGVVHLVRRRRGSASD